MGALQMMMKVLVFLAKAQLSPKGNHMISHSQVITYEAGHPT